MKKLTLQESRETVDKARKLLELHPEYRFGQALWNCLPIEMQSDLTGTEYDFYYETKALMVRNKFVEGCVE